MNHQIPDPVQVRQTGQERANGRVGALILPAAACAEAGVRNTSEKPLVTNPPRVSQRQERSALRRLPSVSRESQRRLPQKSSRTERCMGAEKKEITRRAILEVLLSWGISSAGRAPDLHSGGQRFDPAILHQSAPFLEARSYILWTEFRFESR